MVRGISGMNAALALALLAHTGVRIVPDEDLGKRHAGQDPEPEPQGEPSAVRPLRATSQPTASDLAAMDAATSKRTRRQAKRASLAKTEG